MRQDAVMGHGVWTREPIQPGEALVSIPYRSTITLKSLRERHYDIEIDRALRWMSIAHPHLGDLASFGVALLLESRGCGPNAPRWTPYLNAMDPSLEHPLLWSLDRLGKESERRGAPKEKETIVNMQHECMSLYQMMLSNVHLSKEYCPELSSGAKRVTLGELKWVIAHLLSNIFGIHHEQIKQIEQQPKTDVVNKSIPSEADADASTVRISEKAAAKLQLALIPFVHLFNHSPKAASHYKYNPHRNTIDFWSVRSYNAGDQVFLKYGHRLKAKILWLNYGIVLDEDDAEDDAEDDGTEDTLGMETDAMEGEL